MFVIFVIALSKKPITTRTISKMSVPQHFDPTFSGEVDVHHLCGATYKGQIKNGKRHGQGKLTYANGIAYHGNFKNNNIHGDGSLLFPNGHTFKGKFKNNVLLPEKLGTYDFSDGSRLFGKPEGKMSEFLKQSMDNPVLWPLRFYCPVSRHISTEQYQLMKEIDEEIIVEKRRLLRFEAAAAQNDSRPATTLGVIKRWVGEREEDVKKYDSLAQGWYKEKEEGEEEEEDEDNHDYRVDTLQDDGSEKPNTRYDYEYDPDYTGYQQALEDWGFNEARKEGLKRLAKKEERKRRRASASGLESESESEQEES